MGIHDELVKLESEMASLEGMRSTNPVAFQKKLVQINSELSVLEKVIAKQDEEDDWDPDDSDDSLGDADEGEDDGDDEFDNPGRRRLLNRGEPMQYQKAYSQNASSGSPLGQTHKFETVVQRISAERGISKTDAAVAARRENGTLFESYQESGLQGNAAASHQALVTAQMDKGHSELIAKQQIAHLYGSTPIDLMKGDTPVTRFNAVVTKLMAERGIERTAALRLARKRNPALFAKYCEC
jgi:hypothetical protein